MIYRLDPADRFKREFKNMGKHPEFHREDFEQLAEDLMTHEVLPDYYREHDLTIHRTDWRGYLSADLSPDVRVIFTRLKSQGIVRLHRIGSHAQLYKGYLRLMGQRQIAPPPS